MGKRENLVGQVFGRLTALEIAPNKGNITRWKCICECGNEKIVATADLKRGHTQSCGCYNKQRVSEASLKDYKGQRFGHLEVLDRDMNYTGKGCQTHWYCLCHKCGQIKSINSGSIRNGAISCGCAKSKGEYKIMELLRDNNISFISEFSFNDFKNRRYDFALLDENKNIIRLIEYDSIQHYYRPRAEHWSASSSLEETQQRDKEKNNIAKIKGIPLIRIPYWHLEKININNLLDNTYLIREE